MHGGAIGAGGQAGKRNGRYRHGGRTRESMALHAEVSAWARMMRAMARAVAEND